MWLYSVALGPCGSRGTQYGTFAGVQVLPLAARNSPCDKLQAQLAAERVVFMARSPPRENLLLSRERWPATNLRRRGLPIVDESHSSARRRWLLRTLQGTIGITLAAILYPVARFLKPRRATVSGALEVVAPLKPKDLVDGSAKPFDFAGKPCLLVLISEGAKRLARGERLQADDVRAFNAICTHVDCTVRYRPGSRDLFCSCHDGVYDLDGRNVSGPPPRPLETYKVMLRGEAGEEEIVISRRS